MRIEPLTTQAVVRLLREDGTLIREWVGGIVLPDGRVKLPTTKGKAGYIVCQPACEEAGIDPMDAVFRDDLAIGHYRINTPVYGVVLKAHEVIEPKFARNPDWIRFQGQNEDEDGYNPYPEWITVEPQRIREL
jgi:hypothetical protein